MLYPLSYEGGTDRDNVVSNAASGKYPDQHVDLQAEEPGNQWRQPDRR
jgi:hypothetical protein